MRIPPYISDLPNVVIHTFVIYAFLVLGFRYVGRRQLGQLTVVDFVVILVMGSAVETAMVNGNTSLPAGLVSASVLFLCNRAIGSLCLRSRRLRHMVTGGPVVLVHHGHIVEEHLRRTGLTMDDLQAALRARGFDGISQVRYAVLEDDGEINAVAGTAMSSSS